MIPIKKILCPVDFSIPSQKALGVTGEFARLMDAQVIALNVVEVLPMPTVAGLYSPTYITPDTYTQMSAHAEENLNLFVSRYLPVGIPVTKKVLKGSPSQEIIDLAESEGVGLIIIATHGISGWRHLTFGSVTEKIIRQSKIPVLSIREDEAQPAAEAQSVEEAPAT